MTPRNTEHSHLRPLLVILTIVLVGFLIKLNEAWVATTLAGALLFLTTW